MRLGIIQTQKLSKFSVWGIIYRSTKRCLPFIRKPVPVPRLGPVPEQQWKVVSLFPFATTNSGCRVAPLVPRGVRNDVANAAYR